MKRTVTKLIGSVEVFLSLLFAGIIQELRDTNRGAGVHGGAPIHEVIIRQESGVVCAGSGSNEA